MEDEHKVPRGRARGRARARANQDALSGGAAAIPGSSNQPTQSAASSSGDQPSSTSSIGRGRSRHNIPPQAVGQSVPPQFSQGATASAHNIPQGATASTHDTRQLTQSMDQMKIQGQRGESIGKGQGDSSVTRGGLQRRLKYCPFIESNVQPNEISDKIGTLGQPIKLVTNYTALHLPDKDFYVYDSKFSWPLTFKQKFDCIKSLQSSGNLPGGPIAYDGLRIYSANMLTPSEEDSLCLEMSGDKKLSLRQVSKGVAYSEQHYQLCNIIMNNVQVLLGQDRVGRKYFMPGNASFTNARDNFIPTIQRFEHLSLHGGYETAIQRGFVNNRPLPIMHISKSHRILSEKTSFEFLAENGLTSILGRQVITKYNNRTYTVNDVKNDVNIAEASFEMNEESGEAVTVTYLEYFRKRYNITLTHRVQAFLITRPKRRDVQKLRRTKEAAAAETVAPDSTVREIYLPSELCNMCGLSESERMNYQRNKMFNAITKRGPSDRVNDVTDFQQWVKSNAQTKSFLSDWNFQMDQQPLAVTGREIPVSKIVSYDVKNTSYTMPLEGIKRGEWDPKNIKVNSAKVYKLGILYVQNVNSRNFVGMMTRISEQMNLTFAPLDPDEDVVQLGRGDNIANVLREFYQMNYDIVLVVALRNNDYSMIKMVTVDTGLLTQCILKRNFEDQRKGMSIATKVAVQIACKLGLDPWRNRDKFTHKLRTMVVGIDTYMNKSQKKSVHAAVFSCNPHFTQYINVAWTDSGRQEFNASMSSYFRRALDVFKTRNNWLPGRIIVYRDGVSDSQLDHMKSVEVETLKVMLAEVYVPQPPPHLIVVVVKKRIAARFFLQSGHNRFDNPSPGTVVDTGIVKPNFYEFFAVSQCTRQGTATPTNYNIVEDTLPLRTQEHHLNPSEVQSLTLNLTQLYYNWPGAIRVPAPAHYAHRLAFLVGTSLPQFKGVHENVQDKLFYL